MNSLLFAVMLTSFISFLVVVVSVVMGAEAWAREAEVGKRSRQAVIHALNSVNARLAARIQRIRSRRVIRRMKENSL